MVTSLPVGRACIAAAVVLLLSGGAAAAQVVTISGSASLLIDSVVAVGSGLHSDDESTTYDVSNPLGTKKIVGRLSSPMPANTVLTVRLQAPSGAVSAGSTALTANDQDLVTGIGVVNQSGLDMTFTLAAEVSAGVISEARTLTLTIVEGP